MGDRRSRESENYALSYCLKLDPNNPDHLVKSETALIQDYRTVVPEGIFKLNEELITVEVKRIPGNILPCEDGSVPRKLRRRGRITWPWESTVVNAMKKATPSLSSDYGISRHHVIFVIPNTLNPRTKRRLHQHILATVDKFRNDKEMHPNIQIHIIDAPIQMFDRLCDM